EQATCGGAGWVAEAGSAIAALATDAHTTRLIMISLLRSNRQFDSTIWTSPGGPLFTAPAAQPLRRTAPAPTSATVSAGAADTGGAPPLRKPPHLCDPRPGAAGPRPTPRGPAAGDGRGPDARDHRGGAGSRAPGKGRSHLHAPISLTSGPARCPAGPGAPRLPSPHRQERSARSRARRASHPRAFRRRSSC